MPLSLCSSACTYTYIIVWHWLLTYQKGLDLGNLKKEEKLELVMRGDQNLRESRVNVISHFTICVNCELSE